MTLAPRQTKDPIRWTAAFALGFWGLVLANLAVPSTFYFDEVHYLPAARELLALGDYTNREHPLLGKTFIAAGMLAFGDNSFGWRFFPSLAGALTLFAVMRALWFATMSRFATLAYGILVASGFFLFVHSRIAMLDIFMIAGLACAYWQLAGAMREPETGRGRLALAGIALGLALGAKWNAIPLAVLPGLAFVVLRWLAGRRHLLTSRRGAPVPGITLIEAGLWLGLVPLAVYALTFLPGWFFARHAIEGGPFGLVAHHRLMLELQQQVVRPHPYMSTWEQWLINWRAIWYLYENVDGAQRGVLLIGNPVTMIAGLGALLWCAWDALRRRTAASIAITVLYAVSLGFWIVAAKPIQFYYHYFLPSLALLGAVALVLDRLWQSGRRKTALAPLLISVAVFAWYFPILSAMPLCCKDSYQTWMWLDSWR